MPTYGLSEEGFLAKTFDVLIEELRSAFRGAFGSSIDVSFETVEGQLVAIIAERDALLWELLELIYNVLNPNGATGAALENIAAITGTLKQPATKSAVALTLLGIPTTLVPAGSQASTASTEKRFETIADATIDTLPAWGASTAYVLGARVTNGGRVYVAAVPGVSAGAGAGPAGTDPEVLVVDGAVSWRYVGLGTGAVDVDAAALDTGPTVAVSGDVRTIETPITGWQSVVNLLDAEVGSDIMTDPELRIARQADLQSPGKSPLGAIRSELLDVGGVTAVTVFQNVTDYTDSDGIPPHSVEALVTGGDDQAIWDALLAGVAGGIRTHGDIVGTATDDEGTEHEMRFSRPEDIEIWVELDVVKDPNEYPAAGDAEIRAAIVEWGDAQRTGKDVVAAALIAQAFKVPGVLDVTAVRIGTAPAPLTGVTIPISLRERAAYDTSRIVVTSTNGVP